MSKSHTQALLDLLGELQAGMESLAQLEELKTLAIATRDLDALADLTTREHELNAGVRALEQERRAAVIGLVGPDAPEPTIRQLADSLPGLEGSAIRLAGEELRAAVDRLQGMVRRNAELLAWSADLARATAQWLLGYGATTPAYTRWGDREAEPVLSARGWSA